MSTEKNISGFMRAFLDTPEPETDQEYVALEEQYFQRFGHGVPREMLPDSLSDTQIKQALKDCLLAGKDDLFRRLGVTIRDDCLY